MIESGQKLAIGTKVRVVNYPPNADPRNRFVWNGKIGSVKSATSIGTDVNKFPVYEYDVFFEGVEVETLSHDPQTNRLIRKATIQNAENRFNVAFLDLV